MRNLEPPDLHFLNAALGWLELGNPAEARLELSRISPAWQLHPDVLTVSWDLDAKEKKWESALEKARRLIRADPNRPDGWIKQSYCLHELKMTADALTELLAVSDRFPQTSLIPYNLACYYCQLGEQDEAQKWLARAMELGGKAEILAMALTDPDLLPLRSLLEKLKR